MKTILKIDHSLNYNETKKECSDCFGVGDFSRVFSNKLYFNRLRTMSLFVSRAWVLNSGGKHKHYL